MSRKAYIPIGATVAAGVIAIPLASPASADTDSPTPTAEPVHETARDTAQETRWVAMGDSYQSGVGTGDFYDDSGDCLRSPQSHVELLNEDETIPGDLDFVACSGARLEHMYAEYEGEPPQLDALEENPDEISHVSVGIGGNDLGFADTLLDCIIYDWPWSSCESRYDEDVSELFDEFTEQDADDLIGLQRLYTDIWSELDDSSAAVTAFSYPKFFPAEGGDDWTSIPFQPRCNNIRVSDQLWINNWIERLNTTILDSAESTGVQGIDLYSASEGHELCNPEGNDAYMNGIQLSSDAFHPTELGYELNAEVIRPELDAALNAPVRMAAPEDVQPLAEPPAPPEAEVNLDQDGNTVTLEGSESTQGDGAVDTYLWEFDDGELAEGEEVTHTYDEPGTYYLTLTVIDENEEMGFSEPQEIVID